MLLGVALRWYAIWTLGKYFTREVATRADQSVMQTGPTGGFAIQDTQAPCCRWWGWDWR